MNIRYNEIASLAVCTMLLALWLIPSASTIATDMGNRSQTIQSLSSMPLAFTANQGQWDHQVQFRANAGGATMWFSSDGAYYQFTRRIETEDASGRQTSSSAPDMAPQADSVETFMIKVNYVGSNADPIMRGLDMMEYKCNYFIGNDPIEWHTDVPNYSAIVYEQVYDGIDLKYYGNGKQMEYDFIVSPGADFSQIRIQYEGAESISVNAFGELVIETAWGDVVEQRPMIYQVENNNRIPVDGEYLIQGDDSFGFELTSYNPELLLVIDPVLSYSTYLGGSGSDYGYDIAVDDSGAVYVTGEAGSTDFPMLNSYQGTHHGGDEVFVTKLSSSGNSLVYSTYLGGSDDDRSTSIAIDASGSAYVTGVTSSTDFPTFNPYQGTYQGVYGDAFVTKLSSFGNNLIYSTYLGGSGTDIGNSIAVDASGSAYVTGRTRSSDFPTLNPYQGVFQGTFDAFVTKLSNPGNSLVYSTYLGGIGSDEAFGIAVDASGAAYVTGSTSSTDFPTFNPYQGTYQGVYGDAFVTKLSSFGNNLIYSTYLGGSGTDIGNSIAVDASGSAYVTGRTYSTDLPMLNPYQGTYQGVDDAFVTKLSSSGNSLVYSTYLGGGYVDIAYGIAVDASGATYVTGYTQSTDFPTLNSYQGTLRGASDAFVTKLSSSGNSLEYSTYFGGSNSEGSKGITVDDSGSVYITGHTSSADFQTLDPYQGTSQGSDTFVSKFGGSCCNLPGDFNHNGTIDIADLSGPFSLVSFMFQGGPPPPCPAEGDFNGDGSQDIADLSGPASMVAFMFQGGPDPVCGPASL